MIKEWQIDEETIESILKREDIPPLLRDMEPGARTFVRDRIYNRTIQGLGLLVRQGTVPPKHLLRTKEDQLAYAFHGYARQIDLLEDQLVDQLVPSFWEGSEDLQKLFENQKEKNKEFIDDERMDNYISDRRMNWRLADEI